MEKVFVYGTLRINEANSSFMEGSNLLAAQCWTYGELHDTGNGYPVMKDSLKRKTYGELYEVTKEKLVQLDELEDYVKNRETNLFVRELRTIYTDIGTYEAFVYIVGDQLQTINNIIEINDWRVYRYLQTTENLAYFAYGSCMDDNRFQLAGVAHYFKKIIGTGVLSGYSLRFSRPTDDGGKADLVEDGEGYAEGVIYEVSKEAITYLYKREGVNSGMYRPAVIEVEQKDKSIQTVLTFLVVEKEAESAPSEVYATEILRGGKRHLSEQYYRQLEHNIQKLQEKARF
ncbi:gamma-glutamylcyclotransferase [Caldibacillus lycopersici]|uniref:Gamma-glutamylcyclotransferase n=1 Tax=Perspicuibacillus lycopersici TaxID=1325689 RepID=A0AAE3IRZ4_9BACI|nr:gamma-glutamylcyclotransferase family protein [Perspicuibacillus lycopersici]MCU9613538.1 gamma-glutamylcyclotransferase [Perspicuibacillus lycopersici]